MYHKFILVLRIELIQRTRSMSNSVTLARAAAVSQF
jgi:hypothetical protein